MKNKTEKIILEKIRSGEVKMKPRWRFEVEKKSVALVWLMCVAVAAVSAMSVVMFWQLYNPIDVLGFGEVGQQLLLEDFPYFWLAGSIILLILGMWTFARIGNNYKKSTMNILLTTAVIAIVLTILFRFVAG